MFPCKYSSGGCMVTLLHTEKIEHEETCEFRPYSCPCPGASCKWQGSLEQVCTPLCDVYWVFIFIHLNLQVMAHLMQVHKSITTLQGEDIVFLATDINLPGKRALQFEENQITFKTNSFNRVDEGNAQFFGSDRSSGNANVRPFVRPFGSNLSRAVTQLRESGLTHDIVWAKFIDVFRAST